MAFLIEPIPAGTTVTMQADIRGRRLSRLIAPMVTKEMGKSTLAALADLKRLLEQD